MYSYLIPDLLPWLPPIFLASSLNSAYLLKRGIPDRRGNSFQMLHCGCTKPFPHCAVWKSWSTSLAMHSNELLKMPEHVRAHAFSFPSPFLPFSKPPLLPVSPPSPLSPPSLSQFCSAQEGSTLLHCKAFS